MNGLHISPDRQVLFHAAAAAVLYLRVRAGTLGLLAGEAAFVHRKGSLLHRQACVRQAIDGANYGRSDSS